MILYNNREVEFGQFPNKEINLRKAPLRYNPEDVYNLVTLKYEGDQDLFRLLLLKEYLDSVGIKADLRIPYFPYSRMDRDSDTYAFTLKSLAKFINGMNWPSVIVYEPHSDVTPALLNNVKVINVVEQLIKNVGIESYQVYYPDAGAEKRYSGIHGFESMGDWIQDNALLGVKHRNFYTGKIESLKVIGHQILDTVVMVDDLCSKGGTFMMGANELKEMGFKTIILVVAHCEYTILNGDIFSPESPIDHVITTDSIIEKISHDKLTLISINEFR